MSDTAAELPLSIPQTTRLTNIGVGLVVLAFIGPYVTAQLGLGEMTAFQAGRQAAETLGTLLFLVLIAWLVTRGRTATAKARARVVVGLLLCTLTVSNIAQTASEMQKVKAHLAEALMFRDQQAAKFTKLGERFDAVDLRTVLTPQSMVTRDGHAAARATLATYRSLLAERRALVQTYLLEYEKFMGDRPLTGDAKAGAEEGMKGKREATVALYSSLDEVQTGLADSMERVLDWGAAQAGRLGMQNGQLLFTEPRQQTELNALLAQVTEAEKKMNTTLVAAQATQQRAQQEMADQNRRASEILKK